MLKILIIVPTLFGHDGISNVAKNYYIYQNHNEVKMDFVTINEIDMQLKTEINKNKDKHLILPFRNNRPIKYIYELKKFIKKNSYNIVHVHGCSATLLVEILASKLAGVRIRIAHSHNTTCNHVIIDRILRPFFANLCTERFACSEEAGKWMFNKKSFDIISNGIDIEKFSYNEVIRNEYRKKYKLDDKLIIGHVGRFSLQKNHKKLIEIFEEISIRNKKVKLVLIGEGELKEEINTIAKNKNLDVLFVGNSDNVEKWLQAIDLMVFPSLFEGLPVSIIEAQAAGIPCVLSNTISSMIAITDLIHFIDLNEDSRIWAEEILKINLNDRNTNKSYLKNQIINANFDIRVNCKRIEEKYKKLVGNYNNVINS